MAEETTLMHALTENGERITDLSLKIGQLHAALFQPLPSIDQKVGVEYDNSTLEGLIKGQAFELTGSLDLIRGILDRLR